MSYRQGRPRRSSLTRKEQARRAQEKYRKRMSRRGLRPVQAYMHSDVVAIVDADADRRKSTRGERIEVALRRFYRLSEGAGR